MRSSWWHRARGPLAIVLAATVLPACAARGSGTAVPPSGPAVRPAAGPSRVEVIAACEVTRDLSLPPGDRARVGGLSGVLYEPDAGTYLTVSDDQRLPRLLRFRLEIGSGTCRPTLVETIPLAWPEDATSSRPPRDFEDLARWPGGDLLLVNESELADRRVTAPGLRRYTARGAFVAALDLRGHVRPTASSGVRDNAAFESVTVTPDGQRVYVAIEQPLRQDDEPATFSRGGASRLLEYRRAGDTYVPAREFALPLDPVPHPGDIVPTDADMGIVALTALDDDGTLLMLERSFVRGTRAGERASRNDILLSRLSLDRADDVAAVASLRHAAVRPVGKQRVLSLGDLAASLPPWLSTLDNFEGMAIGPAPEGGGTSLVLVSDDNFNAAQRTVFVVLRLR